MSNFNFKPLIDQFPAVIAAMPPIFTAHEFILRLAQQHQTLYIEALYAYRNIERSGHTAPFMMVHGVVAQRLADFPSLIRQIEGGKSVDIFGQENRCSRWQKVTES